MIGRVALAPAGSQVRDGEHESRAPATCGQLGAQPRHDLVGGDFAFGVGLQRHVDEARVGPRPPVNPTTLATAGSSCTMVCNCVNLVFIAWKGDALIALNRADDEARVLDRKQAIGRVIAKHVVVEPDGGEEG